MYPRITFWEACTSGNSKIQNTYGDPWHCDCRTMYKEVRALQAEKDGEKHIGQRERPQETQRQLAPREKVVPNSEIAITWPGRVLARAGTLAVSSMTTQRKERKGASKHQEGAGERGRGVSARSVLNLGVTRLQGKKR